MSLQLSEADLGNPDALAQKIMTLAEIVVRKHFYASENEKEDLRSIGILKAYTMLSEGNFDNSKGNLATYLYTGMRNDMHNYLYHQNKFNLTDIDNLIEDGSEDTYFQDDTVYLEYGLVHSVCIKFFPAFGDAIEADVIETLKNLGYTITGMIASECDRALSCCNDILLDRYGKEAKEDIIGRLVGLIIWKRCERGESYGS